MKRLERAWPLSGDAKQLAPGGGAGYQRDPSARYSQQLRQQCDQGFIRSAIRWRRGQRDLFGACMDSDHSVFSCAWVHPYRDAASICCITVRWLFPSSSRVDRHPFAEEGGAYAYAGAPLFDGDGEVV
jgi:hypothetical protein